MGDRTDNEEPLPQAASVGVKRCPHGKIYVTMYGPEDQVLAFAVLGIAVAVELLEDLGDHCEAVLGIQAEARPH